MGKVRMSKHDAISDRYPYNCMICIEKDTVHTAMQNFTYIPSWAYIGFLFGFLPGLILSFIVRKTGSANLQLCENCYEKWKALPSWGCLIALAEGIIFVSMIAAFFWESVKPVNMILGYILALAFILIPIVYSIAWNNKYAIHATYIDEGSIELKFPNDKYHIIYNEFSRRPLKQDNYY